MQCRVTGFFKFSTVRYGTGLVTIICIPDIDASSTSSGSLSIPSSNNKNDDNQHHLTTKPVSKVTWRNRKQEECDPDFRRSRHPVMIPMGIAASPVAPMGYGGQQQHPHVATSAMVIPHMMTSHHHQIPVGYHGNTLANTQTNVTTVLLSYRPMNSNNPTP